MKKNLTLFMAFFCGIALLQAQNSIKGKVLNQAKQPIDFAELHLLKETDDQLVQQGFTSETGEFNLTNIPTAQYTLTINYLGQQLYTQNITLDRDLDLGEIITESSTALEEIVLQAEKKLVERKADRLVFNTSASIASQGMDAIEALKNTPMVKVQNDKISLVGKSSVTIMINDKIVHLQAEALTNYLKTLRSDDIEKIEVITNPPSKYEASGNSGLINIVLKQNKSLGLYGSVSSSYSYNNYNAISGNGSLNYQNKKWNLMLKANGNDGRYGNVNSYTYTNKDRILDAYGDPTGNYNSAGLNLTTNYQLSSNSLVGVTYDLSKYKNSTSNNNESKYIALPTYTLDSVINSLTKVNNNNLYQTLNTFYDYNIDSLGSKLSLGMNYFTNAPEGSTNMDERNSPSNQTRSTYFTNDLNYKVWSGTADLSYKLPWVDVEFGGKYTNYDNRSKVFYYNRFEDQLTYDTTRSNRFNYKEDNYAGYLSLNKQLNDKWNVKGGVRFEQTEVEGHLLETNEKFTKSYNKWFPSVFVAYNPNEKHAFSFNYSKRINRPYSSILNPFRYYANTYSYNSGNPELDPSFTDNFELNYLFNSALSVSFNYYHISNSFDQYSTLVDDVFVSTYYNMLNSDNYGITASYSEKITGWWQTSTGTDLIYGKSYYRNSKANQIPQNGVYFSYYSQNTFTLNQAKTLNVFLNWYHQVPHKEDNSKYAKYQALSTGLKANLLDRKLNLNLSVYDIFNTGKSSGTSYFQDNIQSFSNTWNSRSLSIGATYTFGDSSNKKSIKEATFSDKSRSSK
ncbi:TonB-dependent receptor domain-containing protein [Myroides sp. WP-1]|uniref:TonB-dependent receptor domain-containing protein n=1 Tax=Myroides sp. WP-1 TaxID=2759944 RepID=UPI0015FB7537|nr:TonB-dependent receptor [Myroides sp. WP-1]MBB1138259.1 TonB-dependent receptor [Myroides sp. WP-1]